MDLERYRVDWVVWPIPEGRRYAHGCIFLDATNKTDAQQQATHAICEYGKLSPGHLRIEYIEVIRYKPEEGSPAGTIKASSTFLQEY